MLTDPLPTTLDVRKAAVRGVGVTGVLQAADLPRFRALLAQDEGSIEADLRFARDEEGRYVIDVIIDARVTVHCQRCLEAMPQHVVSDNRLAIVWNDEQAAHLPRHLDPLIVDEQSCNLWGVVEEELMLAMPAFSYHDSLDCKERIALYADAPLEEEPQPAGANPFNVLEQLKPGSN